MKPTICIKTSQTRKTSLTHKTNNIPRPHTTFTPILIPTQNNPKNLKHITSLPPKHSTPSLPGAVFGAPGRRQRHLQRKPTVCRSSNQGRALWAAANPKRHGTTAANERPACGEREVIFTAHLVTTCAGVLGRDGEVGRLSGDAMHKAGAVRGHVAARD